MLHASIRENERRARLAGDEQASTYWAGREEAFQDRHAYLAEIAAMMDDRTQCLSQHAAQTTPPG